jgi:hypothetical protein
MRRLGVRFGASTRGTNLRPFGRAHRPALDYVLIAACAGVELILSYALVCGTRCIQGRTRGAVITVASARRLMMACEIRAVVVAPGRP